MRKSTSSPTWTRPTTSSPPASSCTADGRKVLRLALALVIAAAAFVQPVHGAMPLEEVRAMERRAASDPKKAIVDGQAKLAAAEKAGDKQARLAALRLLALSHD